MNRLKRFGYALLVLLATLVITTNTRAAHGEKRAVKQAILLSAFGTSVPEAQKAFDIIEVQARNTFPNTEIRWAFTSKIIRAKLAKQGKQLDSPEEALAKLMADHFTHVAVLSLQTIPGVEFHQLVQNATLFGQMSGGIEKIQIARPLLSSGKDMETVADTLLKNIPERKTDDAVIFMGHGTEHHPSDAIYLAMNSIFQQKDPKAYVATVEGMITIQDIIPKLKEQQVRKIYLVPMMLVAGDHAMNDMAGDEPESWKSILTKNGFVCEPVMKGTAEYPQIVNLWLDHLKTAMAHF